MVRCSISGASVLTNNVFRGIEALHFFADIGVERLHPYRKSVNASFDAGGELLIS